MKEPINYSPNNKDYVEPIEWELDVPPLTRTKRIEGLWNDKDNNKSVATQIMNKENLVYLYGVDELAGGEGLSTYDLTLIASKDFKWFTEAVDAFDDEEAA